MIRDLAHPLGTLQIDTEALTVTLYDTENQPIEADGYPRALTEVEQQRWTAWADHVVTVTAERAARDEQAATAFDLLYAATTAIREWCGETQAWLYTGGQGAQGVDINGDPFTFDQAAFLTLVQQAETAGLAYNALPPESLTPALIQEQAGMALRGQQAQILYGMAKAVG